MRPYVLTIDASLNKALRNLTEVLLLLSLEFNLFGLLLTYQVRPYNVLCGDVALNL